MTKQLLTHLVQSIVDLPDEVSVTASIDPNEVNTFEITVAQKDRGKVIGKEGKTIRALRMVARAFAKGQETAVVLVGDTAAS